MNWSARSRRRFGDLSPQSRMSPGSFADPKKTPPRTGAFDLAIKFKTSRSLWIDLGVVALGVPFIDDIVDLLDVALGIELHLADHSIPRAGLDRIHDFLRIGGAGLRHRLPPDLHRGIGVHRAA